MDDAAEGVVANMFSSLLGLAIRNGAIALFSVGTEADRDAFVAGHDVVAAFWPDPASDIGLGSRVVKGADVLSHPDPARTASVRMNAIPVESEAAARALAARYDGRPLVPAASGARPH